MEIRKPDPAQLETILALSPQAMFDSTMGRVKPSGEKIKRLILSLLEKGCSYFIAVNQDTMTGWILLGPAKDQFTDEVIGFIYELYVIPEFRGKGISKELMNHAINHLKREGYIEIRLSAFVENHAVELYRKLGFRERSVTMSLRCK